MTSPCCTPKYFSTKRVYSDNRIFCLNNNNSISDVQIERSMFGIYDGEHKIR